MDTFFAIVFLISAIAVIPAFVASIYCSHVFNRYLRHAHPEAWVKIAPNPAAESSLSAPSTRFVTQRTYRSLNDERLNALGDRSFRLLYIAASIFMLLVFSGLYQSLAPKLKAQDLTIRSSRNHFAPVTAWQVKLATPLPALRVSA